MSKMASPSPHDLHGLQEWLPRPTLRGIYLTGRDRDIWAHGVDLMCLEEWPSKNQLTSWMAYCLVPKYHSVIGRHIVSEERSLSILTRHSW